MKKKLIFEGPFGKFTWEVNENLAIALVGTPTRRTAESEALTGEDYVTLQTGRFLLAIQGVCLAPPQGRPIVRAFFERNYDTMMANMAEFVTALAKGGK